LAERCLLRVNQYSHAAIYLNPFARSLAIANSDCLLSDAAEPFLAFQPKLPTAHFAEICQLLFGAAVECRYMMRRN
jgi:hypothetical protein